MRHRILSSFLIGIVFLVGCSSNPRVWTVEETKEWYEQYSAEQSEEMKSFLSPLYYQGSTNECHYFMCRLMDESVFIKIKIDDLKLDEIKPKEEDSTAYYYAVDPLNDFKKIEED